ncbi:hypothetical protein FE544_19755, partial [Clostridioides difficile]|nr:hypothetical protein [Clostridioides difficile]
RSRVPRRSPRPWRPPSTPDGRWEQRLQPAPRRAGGPTRRRRFPGPSRRRWRRSPGPAGCGCPRRRRGRAD